MKAAHYIILGLLAGTLAGLLASGLFKPAVYQPVSFANAVSAAAPAVVNIYTTKIKPGHSEQPRRDPLLDFFFQQPQTDIARQREISLGSGVIIHHDGFILTSHHVIKNAEEILVLLYDGRDAMARVIGIDPETDLAILKIDLAGLSAIELADLQSLRVGDPALAIGNPYGFGQTVTSGIVSAIGRYGLNLNTYESFIQTDAAINVGSSGGALINQHGQLIGINSAIYSQTGSYQGIGLAVPVDIATRVMRDIIRHGQVIRGWLGLEVTQLNSALARQLGIQQTSGVIITNVYRSGPAHQAGLHPGDIIISIHGQMIEHGHSGLMKVANLPPGEVIQVEFIRNNQTRVKSLTVGTRPQLSQ